ncbi:choline-sulfatase [Thermostilla marina]
MKCAIAVLAILPLAAALALNTVSQVEAASTAAHKPNILVIMTDEHNAGVMGCAGDPLARTPNLDALAAQGVVFDTHYCASPICVPSRQSFTTGKYVSRHNVWGNTVGVPDGTPSLPRLLNAAGYESYLVGKMHYKGGMTHGFHVFDESTGELRSPGKAASRSDGKTSDKTGVRPDQRRVKPRKRLVAGNFRDNGTDIGKEFSPIGIATDMESTADAARRNAAIRFLRERPRDATPFFLVVGFSAPHYPLIAPAEYLEHFKDRIPPPEIPPGYLAALPLNYKHLRNERILERVPPETVKLAREAYYARVEWIDHQIGEVLNTLRTSPFAENTVVIYTADHGENMGEHGLWWKNCLYDTAARVPLIISWPARWPGGQRRAGACASVDLVQTIAELADAKTPADWNGTSMIAWLDDPSFPWKDLAVSEYYAAYIVSGIAMIRQGDWKYVYHCRADENHGPVRELYNLRTDPKELHNLAGDRGQQERLTAMHAALVQEIGEDPERTEARWRAGACPEAPHGIPDNEKETARNERIRP